MVWNNDATFYTYSQENTSFSTQPLSWAIQIAENVTHPLVIAIAYDNVRLGATWDDEWSDILDRVVDVKTATVLLRWFQLPVLSAKSSLQMSRFVRRYGSKILPVWLADTSPMYKLQWSADDELWLSAVRVLFKQWAAKDMAVRQLVSKLGGESDKYEELLLNTSWRLSRVDPLLMGKVVKIYIENVYLPQFDILTTRKMIYTLLSAFTDSEQNTDILLRQKKKALLEDISMTMGNLDTKFVQRGLIERALTVLQGGVLTELEENNLALSLHIEPFRRLLAIAVLERIAQKIGSVR